MSEVVMEGAGEEAAPVGAAPVVSAVAPRVEAVSRSVFPLRRPHPLAATGSEMLLYVFFLGGTATILFIATALTPDPHGMGTHREMGFPACSMIQWFDTPCAFCGMTTCFTLCAGGHFVQAFLTQPFGVVLYALTLCTFVGSGYGLVRRFSWLEYISESVILWGTSSLLVMMVVGWLYKIIVYKNHITF
ncbi:MAG TPA: DUF2752 domain-containing protein [Planctomycetota bacterium]|nr:DUF2752 domain-containing protein [Planctomycetota bacterium]